MQYDQKDAISPMYFTIFCFQYMRRIIPLFDTPWEALWAWKLDEILSVRSRALSMIFANFDAINEGLKSGRPF